MIIFAFSFINCVLEMIEACEKSDVGVWTVFKKYYSANTEMKEQFLRNLCNVWNALMTSIFSLCLPLLLLSYLSLSLIYLKKDILSTEN